MSRVRRFRRGDEAAVRAVMDACYAVDHIPGWTRTDIEVALDRYPVDPVGVVVAEEDGAIVGYCAPRFEDLTVHPDHRRRGHGRRLLQAGLDLVTERGLEVLTLHVPSNLPASAAFADAVGLTYASSLWQFRLPGDREVPEPGPLEGFRFRDWDDDVDVVAFAAFANAAWEGHPTPLYLTPELAQRVAELPDFDPTGLAMLIPDGGSEPIAFAKVEIRPDDAGEPIGYIGQIGVLPAYRSLGLGRWLLRWGVQHVRARGARAVDLGVEARNERALGLYRRAGFEPGHEWPHWVLPVPAPVSAPISAGR